jgi:hypothetical protein
LPELFPHFDATQILPTELLQLIEPELSGISPKFLADALGIFEVESKRYVPTGAGVTPGRIDAFIKGEPNPPSGGILLGHFGAPPFGDRLRRADTDRRVRHLSGWDADEPASGRLVHELVDR